MIKLHIPWEKGQTIQPLENHSVFQLYILVHCTCRSFFNFSIGTKAYKTSALLKLYSFWSATPLQKQIKPHHIMPVNLPQAFPDVLRDQDFHLILPSNEIKMGILLSLCLCARNPIILTSSEP